MAKKISIIIIIGTFLVGIVILGEMLSLPFTKGDFPNIIHILAAVLIIGLGLYFLICVILNAIQSKKKLDVLKMQEKVLLENKEAEKDVYAYYRKTKNKMTWHVINHLFVIFWATATLFMLGMVLSDIEVSDIIGLIMITMLYDIGLIFHLFPCSTFKIEKETILSSKDYPQLFQIIEDIQKAFQIHPKVVCYLISENNAVVTKVGKKQYIGIGVPLILCLNEEELKTVLMHEFAHIYNDDLKRKNKLNYLFQIWINHPHMSFFTTPCLNEINYLYEVYQFVSERAIERLADQKTKEKANIVDYATALTKFTIFGTVVESSTFRVFSIYDTETMPDDYFYQFYQAFLETYQKDEEYWKQKIWKRLPAQIESHPTYKERMKNLDCTISEIHFNERIPESSKLLDIANKFFNKSNATAFVQYRNEYLNYRKLAFSYDENELQNYTKEELRAYASAFSFLAQYEPATKIYDFWINRFGNDPEILFFKGVTLLNRNLIEGIELIYQAVQDNVYLASSGIPFIGQYALENGLEEEVKKARTLQNEFAQKVYKRSLDRNVAANEKVTPVTLREDEVRLFVNCGSSFCQIEKIYLAEKSFNEKERIILIGLEFNNTRREKIDEVVDAYNKILESYLANDVMIYMLNFEKVYYKTFKKVEGSLYYDKKNQQNH